MNNSNLDESIKIDKKALDANLDNILNFKNNISKDSSTPLKTPIINEKKSNPDIKPIQVEEKKIDHSRLKTAPKKAKNEFKGRDEKIDPDQYYRIRDENEHLKKHQVKLNDDIKKLSTALEKVKHGVLLERKLSDRKVINLDDGFDAEKEELKLENDKLHEKTKKLQTIIKGLNSQSVQNAGKSLGRKSLINAKVSLENQSEKNEHLSLINLLREQLKLSQTEVIKLQAELKAPNKAIKNLSDFNKDMKDKNLVLSEIQSKYEKTQQQFDTNLKILEHAKQGMNEYLTKYNDERKKNIDLENRLHLQEANLTKLSEYVSLIDEYKKKEKHLEDRIKDLCENPFIKQAEERGNIIRQLKENEVSLTEATRRLKILEETNKNLEKDNKLLKEQFQIAGMDRDKFKEEAMRFRISNEEKEKHSKHFEEQFKMLGQYGEVDSNFTKILNILKLRDDNTSWMKIDFIEKMNEPENKDPVFLMKEIERLKIEKGMLGSELEKTKSLLQIQQQINEDQLKLSGEDQKILKVHNDKLMKRCEELAKLVDIERLPSSNKDLLKSHATALNNLNDLRRDLLGNMSGNQILADNITEFSRDETETEFGLNENALDVYLGEAFFEEGLEKELGFKLANVMSFLSVDFYLHETETSNLVSGIRPMYNLQLSFKVLIDENFIYYMESDYVLIDVYYIKDNVQSVLGKGKVPLSELINLESGIDNHTNSRVLNGICQLYYAKDNNLLIGSIHYKMRMRQPILETVKWYKERNNLIREISPVHNVMMKKVEKELISMNNFTKGKVMNVTVLITKAVGLKVTGAPRKISPYIFYQFYKFDNHYTEVVSGNDPLFQDVMKYDIVYDNSFHDYVEKDGIQFFILDDSRPLQVELKNEDKTNSINLIDNPEYDDLIGVCKVPLRDLIINDLIQNSFPIFNKKGQHSGDLVLNIFWEQVNNEEESLHEKSSLPYEAKTWEDALIIKLANLLKSKGLNLNSAFEIFDRDGRQSITLVNFKDTILFTFKFTSSQKELEELTELIFRGRTSLSKLEFYKIFAMHLPHEGPMEDLLNKSRLTVSTRKAEENRIVDNISINIGPDPSKTSHKETNSINNRAQESFLKESNQNPLHKSMTQNITHTNTSLIGGNNPNPSANIFDSNRSMKEIVNRLNEYMTKTGKSTPLELYKMFDRDADLKLGKNELANGLSRLGLPLSPQELQRIWKDITENNPRIEKFDYKLFKSFYDRYDVKINTQK